jgi:tetrapyrrole methylase family protein / MazG family protein
MPKITIAGLGPWEKGHLTQKVIEAMNSTFTVFRTEKHPAVSGFTNEKGFVCLDRLYGEVQDFDELNKAVALEVIKLATQYGAVVYAVPGQGMAGDSTVTELLQAASGHCEIEMIPGVDESALFLAQCSGRTPAEAYAVIPAVALDEYRIDRTMPLIVTQIDSKLSAGQVKLRLAALYGDETPIILGIKGKPRETNLADLDRQTGYDHRTILWLAPSVKGSSRYDLYDIVEIMDRLRGPGGCPWDREQTHESLKQYLLEETYETIEAIDRDNMEELCEELGDVLLQVVFHARLASERGDFDINDVSNAVSRKMILRHPHIFGDVTADSTEQVLTNWEAIKKQEKGQNTETGMMKQVPNALPAIMRSMKVQSKAARVGFDWDDVWGAYAKLEEEVLELREAIEKDMGEDKLSDELGDVLFATVNVARFIKVHPEFALKGTVEKFIRRFDHVESRASALNRSLDTMSLDEMDVFWNEAKALEQHETT